MIILNKRDLNTKTNIVIHDLNNYNTSNEYYTAAWKHKYNVSISKKSSSFKKKLVEYLKSETTFVE
jgi:hypothetical protein